MTMKKTLITLLLLLATSGTAFAQTAITSTTLSTAITNASPTSIVINVGSATGMSVGGILWIEGSVYRITAVNSTAITVINTYFPATHLTSAVVYVVPLGAQYKVQPTGSCIRGTAGQFPAYSPYTLMFNPSDGTIAMCRGAVGSRTWLIGTFNQYNPTANPPVTP